jgi:hypothetical protein
MRILRSKQRQRPSNGAAADLKVTPNASLLVLDTTKSALEADPRSATTSNGTARTNG